MKGYELKHQLCYYYYYYYFESFMQLWMILNFLMEI